MGLYFSFGNMRDEVDLDPMCGIYDFGKWVQFENGEFNYPRMLHHACPCREKYYLKSRSTLSKYLTRHCKGFVVDPERKYTLNYIIVVLLVNWKEKHLLWRRPFELEVKDDGLVGRVVNTRHWHMRDSYFRINSLRDSLKLKYFKNLKESMPNMGTALYCTKNIEGIIDNIIGSSPGSDTYFPVIYYYFCDNSKINLAKVGFETSETPDDNDESLNVETETDSECDELD